MSSPAASNQKAFFQSPSGSVVGAEDPSESVELLPIMIKAFKMAGIAVAVWIWGYLGFSVAWVFVALFFHVASEECRKYKESKKTYALQAVLNEREAILSRVDDHSSWVFFPDVEKAEWFNKVIRQMWPFIGEYVREVLKTIVEPSIQSNLPSNLKSFKFDSIDTGDIPPRVDGVKVYIDPKKKDEIICDVDLKYNGDANVKVAVKGVVAGIKNLSVSGTMRVIMKPLTSEIPIIGGLSVFFLNKPGVDFNLTAAANLLDAPVLNKSLRSIVEEQLAYYLVLPHRIPIQLATNVDFTTLKYPFPQGVMRLEVVEAKDLKKADTKVFGKGGKSDPYCKVVVGARERKTKVISNSVNPLWNEQFEFVVDQKHGQFIDLQIFDQDSVSQNDDSLGTANIDVEVLGKNGFIDLWYPLEDVKTGQVYVRAMWMSLTPDINLLGQAKLNAKNTGFGKEDGWSAAILLVTVDRATDLPMGDKSGKARNAFVRLRVGAEKEQTGVQFNQKDPIWAEFFQLLVHDPESDELLIEVFHRGKADKRLAEVKVAVNEVLSADDMTITKTFSLISCGRDSKLTVRLAMRLLVSDVRPRWFGGLGGMKLGRIASVRSETSSMLPSAAFYAAPSAAAAAAVSGSKGIRASKREPSIEMPVMSFALIPEDVPNEGQPERKRSSRETTPEERYVAGADGDSEAGRGAKDAAVERKESVRKEVNVLRDSPVSSSQQSHVGRKPLSESTPVKGNGSSDGGGGMVEAMAGRVRESPSRSGGGFGQIQLTIRYSSQRQQLIVVVHQCTNLIPCDKDNLADPYVRLYLLPDRSNKKKTKLVKNCLSPVFDETFEWPMAQMEAPFRSLDISVKNDVGLFSKSRTDMGRLLLELTKVGDLTKATTAWYDLEEVKTP